MVIQIHLPLEIYRRLHAEADRVGKPVEVVAQEILIQQLNQPVAGERERVRDGLRAAGLLAELSPAEKERAAR